VRTPRFVAAVGACGKDPPGAGCPSFTRAPTRPARRCRRRPGTSPTARPSRRPSICSPSLCLDAAAAARRARLVRGCAAQQRAFDCACSPPLSVSRAVLFEKALGLTAAGIDVKLKTRVTSVDIKGKVLVAEAPGPRRHNVTWDYLIIATGSKVWAVLQASALSVPGATCVRTGVQSGWSVSREHDPRQHSVPCHAAARARCALPSRLGCSHGLLAAARALNAPSRTAALALLWTILVPA